MIPPGSAAACSVQADGGWIGKRVVQKYAGFKLKLGNQEFEPNEIAIYRVEKASGAIVWLQAEGQSLFGWARTDQIVPVEEAIAFFTDATQANPEDVSAFTMRGAVWRLAKHDFDKALADYNEAIRIDRRSALFIHQPGTGVARQEGA